MEIANQIKRYRAEQKLSQDELAEKIFVTRQTISNWENSRNYPDIRSLVLLSNVFGVSLDILIKGDLESMKEQVKAEDIRKLNRDSTILTVLMLVMVISPIPLYEFLGVAGIVIWVALAAVTMYYAVRIEKQKKQHDIQTYKEILAFAEGRHLDTAEKNQEIGKRPYQKVLIFLSAALFGAAVTALMIWLMQALGR